MAKTSRVVMVVVHPQAIAEDMTAEQLAARPKQPRAAIAEDMTAEQLAARPKQPKSGRKASSDEAYAATAKKWWPLFLKEQQWDGAVKGQFIDEAGAPMDGVLRALFVWLYEQDGMTKGVYKPMLAWAQARLNQQLSERLLPPMPEYVCRLPGIKERKDEIWTGRRESHMQHMTDLQASVESDIGFDKMIEMVDMCLNCAVPHTTPLFCMQILFELRATHQQAARHDDLRGEVFAHMFARVSKTVGPSGMPMLCNVTDGGKTNNNGRISYSALLPHRNPLLCTIFAKGALFLWRFLIMKVKFPNLLEPEDIFKRPTLRQGNDEMHGVSYDSSYALMKRLYEAVNTLPTKCLHQGRGECQRLLDDLGVSIDQIRRLCKYVHDEQTESYLLNPPLAALLGAAGFDHEAPRAARAAHLCVPITVELEKALLPQLIETTMHVDAELQATTTGAEAKAKRLFCARGCGRALRLIVQIFIRCSAARARNEAGHILMDTLPIYKRFYAKNRLFQQPFFKSELFLAFAGLVSAAEDREHDGAAEPEDADATGLVLSPIAARLDAVVGRRLGPIEAKMDAFMATVGQAGPATVASAVTPPMLPPAKRRRTIDELAAAQAAKRGPSGIVTYVLAPNKQTVAQLWEEFTTGLNGGPAVRDLIRDHGKKWRPAGGASRTLWGWHSHVYAEIERRMGTGESEAEALASVQARLDAHAKPVHAGRGRPASPANWKRLVKELQAAHPRRIPADPDPADE
jgi:hypothetical protein